MTEEQAREILLKQFDKSCGNYSYQNAHKIDLEQAMFIGAKALEKQIPKKPEREKAKQRVVRYTDSYICPSCGKGFTGTGIADFCYHCGQALDWSE